MSYKFQELEASRRRPQISNTGDTAVNHGYNTYILTSRPQVLALGPAGKFDEDLEFFSGKDWPIRWPYANGDDGKVILDDWSIENRIPGGSRITCDLTIFAAHQTEKYWDPAQPELSKLEELASRMDWSFELEALQLADGDMDWASATQVGIDTQTFEVIHWPTYNGRGTYRLLQTASFIGEAGPYEFNRALKEGMTGIEDAAFMSDHRLSLTLSHGSFDPSLPFRLRASVDATSGTPSYRGPAAILPQSKANLRIYLLGSVYVEHPQPLEA